ncbi:hypothetical protein F5888DRAFT_1689352 [Russula emetica]|nr:hypothetical protein F5888DRAFT_1689352 [Russula emetica]
MLSRIPIPPFRALLHITVSILCFLAVATSRPTQNFTIEVPYGTTNHGKQNFLCIPVTWSSFASYLLFNYLAHGATVVPYPGEPAIDTLLCVVAAILLPGFGVKRAFNFIVRRPVLTAKNDLEMAARSGALCMLVRSSSWKPQKGDNIRKALIKDPGNEPSLRGRNTSRSDPSTNISPTDQYEFAFVPRNTEILGLVDSTSTPSSNFPDIRLLRSVCRIFTPSLPTPKLSSSFNLVKGMAALLQSLYASLTLYRTDDGQVKRYGFAAPGLTVLPYAVMSTVNLMANLVAPHYPTLYLVRSKVMEEAERRTGLPFHYVVGKVVDESDTNDIVMEGWSEIAGSFKDDDKLLYVSPSAEEDKKIEICDSSHQIIYVPACPRFRRTDDSQTSPLRGPRELGSNQLAGVYDGYPGFIIFFSELFIILGLSHFSGRQSTVAQRAWIVTWLVTGFFGDVISDTWKSRMSPMDSRLMICFTMLFYCAPAIGGSIVVFQMLKAYGICYRFI